MLLPNREKAYVPRAKLRDYLLSGSHAVGKTKAKYFQSIGYDQQNIEELADSLLMIAKSQDVNQEVASPYGAKYIIQREILAPTGDKARIRTVWVVEVHDDRPRFVTAYPA